MADRVGPGTIEYYLDATELRQSGPTITVEVAGRPLVALLDTGGAFSVIDIDIARELRLPQEGTLVIAGATGQASYPQFRATLVVPWLSHTVPAPIAGLPLRDNGHLCHAIIGRDVLCSYELTINGRTGLIRFAEA